MAHGGQKLRFDAVGAGQLGVGALQLAVTLFQCLLGLLAHGDVADGADHKSAPGRLQGTEADLDGDLRPVLAPRVELEVRAHGPGAWRRRVGGPVPHVAAVEPLGQQQLDRPAKQLIARVAEQLLGLSVDADDAPLPVHDHGGIGGGVQEGAQARLALA